MNNNIISEFYAVTVRGEVWHISIFGKCILLTGESCYEPMVRKIATKGVPVASDLRIYLHNGPFLAVTSLRIARFRPISLNINQDELLQIPEWDEEGGCFGDSTREIVALLKDENLALLCSKEERLQRCDVRWEEETMEVISEIGLNHPIFAISKNFDLAFPGSLFLESETKKKRHLPRTTEPPPKLFTTEKIKKVVEKKIPTRKWVRQKTYWKKDDKNVEKVPEELPSSAIFPIAKLIPSNKKITLTTEVAICCHGAGGAFYFEPGNTYELVQVEINGLVFYVHKDRFEKDNECYGKAIVQWSQFCTITVDENKIHLHYR